jgi:hypothetical protein
MIWLNRSVTELKLAMTLGQREQDRELTFMKNEPEPRISTMNPPDVDLYLFQWDRAPESRRVSLN